MTAEKQEILAKLKQQLLGVHLLNPSSSNSKEDFGLAEIEHCFPGKVFPTGTVHEFLADNQEEAAASEGFIAGILAKLMQHGNCCLWISRNRKLFPPSLETFGVDPQHIIFIDLYYNKQILWVMEEALKCEGIACVIAEISDVGFAQSRRLQLATEKSQVTGILLRKEAKFALSATTCTARWQIKPKPSHCFDYVPGVGNPCWEVNLLKVKNGQGGQFFIEWSGDRFKSLNLRVIEGEGDTKTLSERGLTA
ncbi:ImuA family protein [Pedobacter sandarakinus]|uniref:ImuA family protein n=1 Tax=Pedobacter sandarakinus TaxID=353156 RepID=UPI00224780B9|nr:Error-prone repair protein ImuA [Pedobacter sandarakinus]MCX2574151.1 Error-prone repair protein ImuA [Pedobacter sandarakinus]